MTRLGLGTAVLLRTLFGSLALLSLVLLLWQWWLARHFPLHQRASPSVSAPGVSLLKPLKGCDPTTASCLRSWFTQTYPGPLQLLLAVASAEDPVCPVVRQLIQEYPQVNARLVVCGPLAGPNLKVSKLAELEPAALHEILIVSDADVQVPGDLVANVILPLQDPKVGLVNCFYRLANPTTPAMHWEAVAINADFWSQVLQSQSLKPLDFALGAVMVLRRAGLKQIGGFSALANCLADDYQLGNRIARAGHQIALCPIVVECWSPPMSWRQVWKHQLRWARTIRVCQPVPYFFSVLSNATFWPLFLLATWPTWLTLWLVAGCLVIRVAVAIDLQRRLTRSGAPGRTALFVILKDLLQILLWLLAFLGNRIEWRGEYFRLQGDGTLVRL